jgi:hypothetical protein
MTTTRTLRVFIDTPEDESPDASWLDQTPAQLGSLEAAVANRRRKIALENGDWYLIGVRLAAEVTLSRAGRVDEKITLTTPGIWGVESDSSVEYLTELAMDEAEFIREDLLALGFTPEDIEAELAQVPAWGVLDRG